MSSVALQLASEALAHARSRRSEDLEDLVEELRIPSVSTLPEHRSDCLRNAQWLRERCERMGADARVVDVLDRGLPLVIADWDVAPDGRHLTIYGHYDVQPVDPIDEWITAPFEPSQRGGALYARGAADNKGNHLAALKALEHLAATVGIPLNVRLVIEGEEEVNGESLPHYLRSHGHEMRSDAVLLWDSVMQPDGSPSLSSTVRGILYTELHATAAAVDLHSGLYGGVAPNPINTLARIIGELKDREGHITIPGFYDAVREPSSRELASWRATDAEYAAALREMSGARALEGEQDYTVWERIGSRPSLDANGIIGGFTGKGKKTVIPAAARAKVSMRLVPDQDWRAILATFKRHVNELSTPGVEVNVEVLGAGAPVTCDVDGPFGEALRGAFRDTIGSETALIRLGGSIPVAADFQAAVGARLLVSGIAQADCALHSPNEHLLVDNYYAGIDSLIRFICSVSEIPPGS
jgi:acetylornithine deacetylase/succinyl-diaminopimelate desuccinylase-like protein